PIDEAHRDEMIDRVDQIIELLAGGISLPHLREGDSAPRRSPVVRIKDREAARGGHLARIGVTRQPAIGVVAFPASVPCEDQRIFLSLLLVEGSEEQSFQLEAVPRLEPNRLLRSEPLGREPGIARRQLPRLPLALRPKKDLGWMVGTLAGKRRRALAGEIESR